MDITFKCPQCNQELEVDASGAGSEIQCPACATAITVPSLEGEAAAAVEAAPEPVAAAPREERFVVPNHSATAEPLIQKASRPLDLAAKDTDKKIRVKSVKRVDCLEGGNDHFDDKVSEISEKIGPENIVSVHPIQYSNVQMGTPHVINDYGIMIVYKG